MYHYYQQVGGEEHWRPVLLNQLDKLIEQTKPMYVTALAVNKLVEDLDAAQRDKLAYEGPFYIDWDGPDIPTVITKVHAFMDKLEAMKVDLEMCRWYITGSKGFHCVVPTQLFMEKPPKAGVPNLPVIYKEMVMSMYVDTIDMRVYSQGRGRMWRQPNVMRENGRCKVQVTVAELRALTAQASIDLSQAPRPLFAAKPPELNTDLAVAYARAQQKVEETMKTRGKRKRDPLAKERATCESVQLMMAGYGIKPGIGFHELALQIAIACTTAGQSEEEMLKASEILCESHQGNGNRYDTPAKRREELVRMHRYVSDNPMYDFSVGAIKVLLTHNAPDLDGIPVSSEDLREGIEEAIAELPTDGEEKVPDEFNDVAGGVTLSKFGVYVATDEGFKRRICAVSFKDIHLLVSMETGQLAAYEAEVLVNGRATGRQTMEMEVFQSLQMYNRFCARLGHAMQGTETHLRGMFMRFIELAKKKGRMLYITKREGLDIVNIPNHEDPELREPFMVWSDGKGVSVDPRIRGKNLDVSFQGFPDPRGLFKTDIEDAPNLGMFLENPANQAALKVTLQNMFTCQRPDVVGKMIGWYTACFYRMVFHRAYNKFPSLHVNGAAGAGKSWRKGTLVIAADGTLRKIEDVKVGDQLLGPDGGVRNVLALGRGRETMYEVVPVKGESYFVNESHILTLRRAYRGSCRLSDGTYVPSDQEILNVNVLVWSRSSAATQKLFKGYRAGPVEFHRDQQTLPVPPYILGAWLGDGHSEGPTISKPYCNMIQAWGEYGLTLGLQLFEYKKKATDCSAWRLALRSQGDYMDNPAREALRRLNVLGNKHIPESYRLASLTDRLQLIAGLLDSDGHQTRGGYDWISKDQTMAEDFVFICRSVGLAAYMQSCVKGIKSRGFTGTYYRVSVSGDCDRIPCLDKKAPSRKQVKNHLVTGLTFKRLDVEDYYGVVLDSDRLLLLGDFTANHNTEMNKTMAHLFYYNQEPKMLTPQSTIFAIQQHMSGSVSIPLLLDEYKPHEMTVELHNKLKLLIRDAYNARDINKGGGTRESDDYRVLSHTQLAAPLVFIAEAAEEEAAVAERVVLVTLVKPPSSISLKWLARYQAWDRSRKHMTVLGKHLAAEAINTSSVEILRKEFDVLFEEARNRFMLTEADLARGDLDAKEMADKQGAKERSVFNFTVARFGLLKFKALVEMIFGAHEFADTFKELDGAIYQRMNDLLPATQAEWAKVMDSFASMSYSVDGDSPFALKNMHEYGVGQREGRNVVEVALQDCYLRYRAYMRSTGSRPLFAGSQSFVHSIKDSPALIEYGHGQILDRPQVYVFDMDELAKMGVGYFKG